MSVAANVQNLFKKCIIYSPRLECQFTRQCVRTIVKLKQATHLLYCIVFRACIQFNTFQFNSFQLALMYLKKDIHCTAHDRI